MIISCGGQAFADSFATIMAARIVYGLGSAVVWTSALAWLSDVSSEETRSTMVGSTVAAAGLGSLIGPAFTGYIAQHFSIEAAYLCIGAVVALVTAGLFFVPAGIPHQVEQASLRSIIGVVGRSRLIVGALLMMFVAGFVDGIVNLLAPLELTANGLTSGETGLVFSIAAAVFIFFSAFVSRHGGWASSPRFAGLACIVQAATLIPVLFSLSSAAVIFVVLARGPASAVVYTVAMPVAVIAARHHGVGTATVAGVVGMFWGFASMIGSPVAGVIADAASDAAAYGVGAVMLLAAGVWLLRTVPETELEPEPVAVG